MILAAVALDISITLLTILLVVVSLLMILVIMMQRPKQEGLGAAFGAGMTDQLLGAGTTSFLQKATVWMGGFFFLISLVLAILIGRSNQQAGIETSENVEAVEELAAPEVPGAAAITAEEEDDLLEAIDAATQDIAEESSAAVDAAAESAEETVEEVIDESTAVEEEAASESSEEDGSGKE